MFSGMRTVRSTGTSSDNIKKLKQALLEADAVCIDGDIGRVLKEIT